MELYVPSIEEQRKISKFLSLLDERIDKQRELIEHLKSYKRGVIQEIFGQSHEWKNYALYEIGEIRTGTTPSTSIPEYYGDKYLWVTPSDIENKEITTTCKKLSELGLHKGRVIPANSVLVTCIASIGKNAVLRQKGSCNQQINAITPFSEFDLDFIYYGICYNESQMHAKAGTGGMEILNKQAFSEIQIKCPKLSEQEEIGKMLSHIRALYFL